MYEGFPYVISNRLKSFESLCVYTVATSDVIANMLEIIYSTFLPCAVLQIGRLLVRSLLVSLEFFIHIKSFRSHYGPGVDSASNRNEYQEHFLGVKAAGA